EGCAHRERLPRGGMPEADLLRMEGLARELAQDRRSPAATSGAGAVDAVADDRVAERGEVDAELMGPPGLRTQAQQRRPRQPLEDLELRDRGPWPPAAQAHPLPLVRMAPDRPVDDPARPRDASVHQSKVGFLDRALAELSREPLERRRRARDEQNARGVAIEPMHDAGTFRLSRRGKRPQAMRERVDH